MLARPDPQVLWVYYGFAFELWLPSAVSRAVQRAPDTWNLRRSRRTKLAFHMTLETEASSLWVATACDALVGVEWRVRPRPGDASLAAVAATLDELVTLLGRIEDRTRELRESLSKWEPARRREPLSDGSPGWSLLTRLRMDADDAAYLRDLIERVHDLKEFDAVVADDGASRALPACAGTRDELPAELLAIAPREPEHFADFRLSANVRKLLPELPAGARMTRWTRVEHAYECEYLLEDERVTFGVPRGDRTSTSPRAIAHRAIDDIASLWRSVIVVADERERALGAIPEEERSYWQKRAWKEIGYVMSWAEVEAFGACDSLRVDLGAKPPGDLLLRLPEPPFPTFGRKSH